MKIDLIVGTRPNFIKAAPIYEAVNKKADLEIRLVHTGQHYDQKMSKVFFEDLGMPEPDINLNVGSGTHAKQTGEIMIKYEELITKNRPDMILVVGDVNSTVAVAIVAKKSNILLGHIEAGLRSNDRTMPEEINRIITDSISDYLFTTSKNAGNNLEKEGHLKENIHFTGNVMIDTLKKFVDKADASKIIQALKTKPGEYILATLHRPSNVDDPKMLRKIMEVLESIQKETPVIFPAHPRTFNKIKGEGIILDSFKNLHIIEPVGYLEFLGLQKEAKAVITDSGGIQEETTILGIPCITLRKNTERPITITEGTNTLISPDTENLSEEIKKCINNGPQNSETPEKWDGRAAERIANILEKIKKDE